MISNTISNGFRGRRSYLSRRDGGEVLKPNPHQPAVIHSGQKIISAEKESELKRAHVSPRVRRGDQECPAAPRTTKENQGENKSAQERPVFIQYLKSRLPY